LVTRWSVLRTWTGICGTRRPLRDLIRGSEEIQPKDVQVELPRLDLHLHRLLFDPEQGAREMAEFRAAVRQFVDRFTAQMGPRTAQQFRQFAQGLVDLARDRAEERWPGMGERGDLTRIVGKLKEDLNRFDLLLLWSLEVKEGD